MKDQPNVLLILCDDMGYSDIGCYGGEIETPNLDALAAGGLRFSSMYNCARCCPSRAALLTGVYPHQAGVGFMVQNMGHPSYQGYLKENVPTIAEVLKTAGYATGYSGKWHAGGHWPRGDGDAAKWRFDDPTHPTPMSRGFDRFYGNPAGGGSYFNIHLINEHGLLELPENFYTTDNYTSAAIDMMNEAAAADQPFFVHLCYNAPHWPLHALPEDIAKYRGRYRQGWDAMRTARHEQLKGMGMLDPRWEISRRDDQAPPWTEAEDRDWEDARMATYAAMVDRVDQNVGRIIEHLRQTNELDNTLIIFLSDNGGCAEQIGPGPRAMEIQTTPDGRPMRFGNRRDLQPGAPDTFMSYDLPWANASNSPFRRFKHWVHEGGISTPLIVHWPRGIAGTGIIRHEVCHLIDIPATVYELAGADYADACQKEPAAPVIEGESFAAALAGHAWQRQRALGFEHEGNCAFRDGDLKLVRCHNRPWELYDMSNDRTEMHDLADQYPEQLRALVGKYNDWAARCEVLPFDEVRAGKKR